MAARSYRIAIDGRRLRATTGRYVRELLDHLQEIDDKNEYHVIIHEDDHGSWQPSKNNFHLHVVGYDHYTLLEQTKFRRFLKQLNPDLVHFTMPQQPILYRGKHVTTIHDLTLVNYRNVNKNSFVYSIKQAIFKYVLKRGAKTSDLIFTDAKYTKKELAKYTGVDTKKIVVAYPAADKMSTKKRVYKDLKNKQFILYVGNTFPYKNILNLIRAHQQLLIENPKLYLVLVGQIDENSKSLIAEVEANKYRQVVFTGFMSEEELAWSYSNAKAYVFPSLSEGFGLPGLEAMQFDLPVVSSNATCLPEIYGEAAHYFNPDDILDIASSINNVLGDRKLQKQLVGKGKTQTSKYSWQDMSKKIHKSYQKVLNEK